MAINCVGISAQNWCVQVLWDVSSPSVAILSFPLQSPEQRKCSTGRHTRQKPLIRAILVTISTHENTATFRKLLAGLQIASPWQHIDAAVHNSKHCHPVRAEASAMNCGAENEKQLGRPPWQGLLWAHSSQTVLSRGFKGQTAHPTHKAQTGNVVHSWGFSFNLTHPGAGREHNQFWHQAKPWPFLCPCHVQALGSLIRQTPGAQNWVHSGTWQDSTLCWGGLELASCA